MATLTLPAKKSILQDDRFGRLILRQFRGRRPPKEIEDAYAKATQIEDKRRVLDLARKLANAAKLEKLKARGLAGKWATSILATKKK